MNPNYLKYTVTIDDLVAFLIHHCRTSPRELKTFHLYQRKTPIAIFNIFLFQAILQRNLKALITGTIIALSICLFATLFNYFALKENNVKKMLVERNRQGETGEHILELTDTEIIEKTRVNETKTKISFLDKIVNLPDYALIYISSVEAYVIPRSSISEGNLEKFLEELNIKIEENSHASDN
ncbi:hypothetical protein Riv7116_2252 [Rivularia sp. PCC 7116]|uniref:YcxB family protein n=1 Tax=Rivularia sp. PCC 7116 TaxID=373994 RepID=UPI00029ECCCF|nr:YcxB family protein [Rivularia sp. PCC 7116]AFY54773.1 hypothetical protein Riv7116_2252 [Rivularia sp. PCC 7116]